NDDPSYLYQWTQTPDDFTTWQNIGGVVNGADGERTIIGDPLDLTALEEDEKIYFRVVAGEAANLATGPFNINDPCRSYSVSEAIEGTYRCPGCNQPA